MAVFYQYNKMNFRAMERTVGRRRWSACGHSALRVAITSKTERRALCDALPSHYEHVDSQHVHSQHVHSQHVHGVNCCPACATIKGPKVFEVGGSMTMNAPKGNPRYEYLVVYHKSLYTSFRLSYVNSGHRCCHV
eukprot:COSAG02_NODE_7124_length_3170_cov_2.440899_2_plen_135_part_00